MDVLNKLLEQLNDVFKSMSPGARITTALLLVAVVVSLGYLFNAQSAGADAYLLNGQSFTADEMSAMEAAFGKAGLSDYTVDGSRIRVLKSRQAAFLGALADANAMPARFGDYLTRASSGAGPFVSRQQQEDMLKVAKQQELALVIRSMKGIENAAVHYDVQKKPGFRAEQIVTASVSVRPRGVQSLDDAQVPMIRSLVSSAIAGLQPDQVTVVDLNGNRAYGGKSGGMGNALDDPYLSRLKEYQHLTEAKILEALSYVPGVSVTANVELDREMVKSVEDVKIDPKTVPLMSKTKENASTQSSGGGPGGRAGFQAQQPGANQPASLPAGGAAQTEDTRTESENAFAASHGRTTTQMAGLTPKRTTVAVGIPSDYFEKVWLQRNPPAAGQEAKKPDAAQLTQIQAEETKKIRDHVAGLIPLPADVATNPVDPTTLVTVTMFSRVAGPELAAPSIVERSFEWLAQSWSTAAMIGLALFALLMLRSFVQAVPSPSSASTVLSTTIPQEEPSEQANAASTHDGADAVKSKPRTLQRKVGSGASLRDELVDMVREDPETAANILRGWIGNVS